MAEYLKIKEVAERLEVSPKTARKYIRNGTIPSSFIAGAYKVHRDDLERYLEEARVAPKDEAPTSPGPHSEGGSGQRRRASLPNFKDFLQEECGSFYLALPHDLIRQLWEQADTPATRWRLYEQIRREHAAVVKLADEKRGQLGEVQRIKLDDVWLRQANTRMLEATERVRQKTQT